MALVAVFDIFQKKHAILRNFPILGHFRYILEAIGPELRQYIVTDNDEERPFTRDQRRGGYLQFAEQDLHDRVAFIGSGKLGLPESALAAFAMGCDAVNVGREAMLSIGCIQAQRCHTGHCPAGVATQNQWLTLGLDPDHKSVRLANYIKVLRKEILRVCHACEMSHPCLMDSNQVEIGDGNLGLRTLEAIYGYPPHLSPVSEEWCEQVNSLMADTTKQHAA